MVNNSKNLINMGVTKKDNADKIKSSPIDVTDDGDKLIIKVNKEFLIKHSSYEINKLLLLTMSPFFLNKDKNVDFNFGKLLSAKKQPAKKPYPHVAFFIENMGHYTGGRYSIFHQAVLLSHYTNVTVVTNSKPPFIKDFDNYDLDKFNIIEINDFMSKTQKNDFDIIVAVPVISGEYALDYANRFDLPLYSIIFETPNWVSKFRDGADSTEEFWQGYRKVILNSDKIIVPSYESKKHVVEWLGLTKKHIDVIYPCMNTIIAKNYLNSTKFKNKSIVFTSRMVSFKSPTQIIRGLGKEYSYHLIGKVYDVVYQSIEKLTNEGYDIHLHGSISDKKKFAIISKCHLLIHPSMFEGFGMPPMEALYFNIPAVVYDLPVLHEIYGNSVVYAKYGNIKDFITKCRETLCNSTAFKPNGVDLSKVKAFSGIDRCSNELLDIFNVPKITAGIIAYNCADYLEYVIKSVYNKVNQIIVIDGRVKYYEEGMPVRSTDGTKDIINEFYDPLNKIEYTEKYNLWNDKIEKQNAIAYRVNGDYYLKLDADEIWEDGAIEEAMSMFYSDNELTIIKMPFHHFWLNFKTVAKDVGGKWSTKHPRIWRWDKGFFHQKSFNHFNNKNDDCRSVVSPYYKEAVITDKYIYHFGYVRRLKILQNKIKYYKVRGIEKMSVDTVTNYKDGGRTQPTQNIKSWAEPFTGKMLEVLNSHQYADIDDIRKEV